MRGADAHDQIYSMPICRYGDLYIGLPSIFHKGDAKQPPDWDMVDTELAIQRRQRPLGAALPGPCR